MGFPVPEELAEPETAELAEPETAELETLDEREAPVEMGAPVPVPTGPLGEPEDG